MSVQKLDTILERAYIFLEDGLWEKADEYCEKALDISPKCADAYLCKLMIQLRVKSESALESYGFSFEKNLNCQKVLQYGDDELKARITAKIEKNSVLVEKKRLELLVEQEEKEEKQRIKKEKTSSIIKKISVICASLILVAVIVVVIVTLIPKVKYNKALEMAESGDYLGAIAALEKLDGYEDSKAQIRSIRYDYVVSFAETNKTYEAIKLLNDLNGYKDSEEKVFEIWDEIADRKTISAGMYHSVVLKDDGKVSAYGSNYDGRCNVGDWIDIVSVAAGYSYTVGLKSDGTVLVAGLDDSTMKSVVESWTDIVDVAANGPIVGLKSDGTVVVTDGDYDVSGWTDIISVAAGKRHIVGLKSDGTVVATGSNEEGECDISFWKDVVSISAADGHSAALHSDGTVSHTGYDFMFFAGPTGNDYVSVAAGRNHLVVAREDGSTVSYYGYFDVERDCIAHWEDVVEVATYAGHIIGLKSNGTVVAAGEGYYGECGVKNARNVKIPEQ